MVPSADACWAVGTGGAEDGGGLVLVFGEDLVIAVRADVGEGERGGRGELALDLEGVGEDGGGGEVGLDV